MKLSWAEASLQINFQFPYNIITKHINHVSYAYRLQNLPNLIMELTDSVFIT